jgi:hypothetical protein
MLTISDGAGPKYHPSKTLLLAAALIAKRLLKEYARSGQAICKHPVCEWAGIELVKGELHIGIHTLFTRNEKIR